MSAPTLPTRKPLSRGTGPGRPGAPEPPAPRFPEPPAFRATPLAPPRACASCASPVQAGYATPRCWGCGRPLCADCYWRHGAAPATHRCTSCLVGGPNRSISVSGARATGITPGVADARPARL